MTVVDETEARFRLQAKHPGETVRVETAGGSADVRVIPAYGPPHLVVTFVIAFCFWAVCFFIFAARFDTEPARTFLWASLGYGLAVIAGDVHLPRIGEPWTFVGTFVRMAELSITPVVFLRIAFIFPRPDPRVRGDRFVLAAAGVAILLFVFESSALITYLVAPGRAAYARFVTAERLSSGFLAFLVVAGSGYLASSTRRAVLTRERQQVKWVAWGSMVGAFPYGLLYALPDALGYPPLVPIEVARMCAGIVPISYGIAVARHQFMDIDVIIRRSLLYGGMAALLTIAYLAVAMSFGGRDAAVPFDWSDGLRILAAGIAIALFNPTRRVLGGWIDRAFFKLRTDHAERAARFHDETALVTDPEDLATRLIACVRTALEPTTIAVRAPLEDAVVAGVSPRAVAGATSRPEIEVPFGEWPADLAAWDWILVQPLASGGTTGGALLLGRRESERRYVEEDLAFLATVGEAAGRALERLQLVRRAAEEAFLRAQQDALDRRKREFLAQVAHDLRTPLTSIVWSAQNLIDGVSGPVPDPAARDVRAIRASAGHLDRLVTHLLEIARLEAEADAVPVPLEPVALGPIVLDALETLAPIARGWDVAIAPSLPEGLPPACARREGVARIVVNLVENALRYSPAGATVEVSLGPDGTGGLALVVRDRGPGVPLEDRATIFERFRRGAAQARHEKTASASPALGLGLSVVRAWMDRFGGAVALESPPDGGARFVCRFIAWSPPVAAGGTPEEGSTAWPAS